MFFATKWFLPEIGKVASLTVHLRQHIIHPISYIITICRTGVSFFLGGGRFSSVFPTIFARFVCASKFCLLETLGWWAKWRANERRPRISQKNENTIFSSGNQNAKLGFEAEKHYLFFPNSSFANSDTYLILQAYIRTLFNSAS